MNKTAFILKHGDKTPAQIVELAKKEKMKLSDKYVYNVRSKAKTQAAKGVPKRGPGRPPKSAKPPVKVNGSARKAAGRPAVSTAVATIEQNFAEAAVNMGLDRAFSVLEAIRQRAKELV